MGQRRLEGRCLRGTGTARLSADERSGDGFGTAWGCLDGGEGRAGFWESGYLRSFHTALGLGGSSGGAGRARAGALIQTLKTAS